MRYQAALRPDRKRAAILTRPIPFTTGSKAACDNINGAQDVRRSTPRHGCRVGEHSVRAEKGVSLVTFFAPAKKVTRSRSE
jgi:hypothetical protein